MNRSPSVHIWIASNCFLTAQIDKSFHWVSASHLQHKCLGFILFFNHICGFFFPTDYPCQTQPSWIHYSSLVLPITFRGLRGYFHLFFTTLNTVVPPFATQKFKLIFLPILTSRHFSKLRPCCTDRY